MRSIRTGATLLASVAALSLGSCTPAQNEALKVEFAREASLSVFGPPHVVSVVGSAVPSGGPSGLHAVGMDLAWRSLTARIFEVKGLGPSPFDVLDPNRPVQVRTRGDTTEIIIR